MKKYVKYIGVLVLFVLLLIFLNWANERMAEVVRTTYRYIEYSILAQIISTILIGFFIGGFYFAREFQKEGNWRINKEKLITIGLPLFLFVAMTYLVFLGVNWPLSIGSWLTRIASSKFAFMGIGAMLGYVAITSFYKAKKES